MLPDQKHLKDLVGFKLGFRARISDEPALILDPHPDALTKSELVYVAIRDDDVCVKIGKVGRNQSLLGRGGESLRFLGPKHLVDGI